VIVVLAFCQHDAELAIKLLRWIQKLGRWPDYSALIVADAGTSWSFVKEAMRIASDIFGAVAPITNEQSVEGWIAGSNSLFKTAAHFCERKSEPFLWLEPDATPLRPNWLSAIHDEYQRCGKPFMGNIVHHDILNQSNPYFEGNGVYPGDCWSRIKDRWSEKISWTLACTERVIDHAVNTVLIQHVWGTDTSSPTFFAGRYAGCPPHTMTLDDLKPDAVLFHRCKDGSLMRLLSNRLFPDNARAEHRPPTFIQLGRFGDLILLLPAFKEWRDRTGLPTPVISSMEFGTVLEGISYVQATLMSVHWHHDLKAVTSIVRARTPNAICTQLHGAGVGAEPDAFSSFSISMWNRTGLAALYHELPLVFDLRNKRREQELVDGFYGKRKPLLLVCFESYTSPFDWENNIMQMLHAMGDKFQILRTSAVKAYRVFDLLGLMDIAAGMITIDTMTLHLAAATTMPYIAFVRGDGQSGSIPKGNCVLKVQYHDVPNRMLEIAAVLDGWANKGTR